MLIKPFCCLWKLLIPFLRPQISPGHSFPGNLQVAQNPCQLKSIGTHCKLTWIMIKMEESMWFLLLTFGLSSQNLTLPKKMIVSRMDKTRLNPTVMLISTVMSMLPPFMLGIRFMIFPLPNFTSPASTSGTPLFPSCFQARYIKPSYLITLLLSSLTSYILSPLIEYFLLHLFSPSLPPLGVKIFLR